eukprot:1187180-Prorocentrum_minimum.AAC.3
MASVKNLRGSPAGTVWFAPGSTASVSSPIEVLLVLFGSHLEVPLGALQLGGHAEGSNADDTRGSGAGNPGDHTTLDGASHETASQRSDKQTNRQTLNAYAFECNGEVQWRGAIERCKVQRLIN